MSIYFNFIILSQGRAIQHSKINTVQITRRNTVEIYTTILLNISIKLTLIQTTITNTI
jgi:hypothetical protein